MLAHCLMNFYFPVEYPLFIPASRGPTHSVKNDSLFKFDTGRQGTKVVSFARSGYVTCFFSDRINTYNRRKCYFSQNHCWIKSFINSHIMALFLLMIFSGYI